MRIPNVTTGWSKALLPAAVIATLIVAPTNAVADQTDAPDAPAAGACQIEDASMQWGLKESFRSYISGSIANGQWETSDGAQYETPNFLWSDGSGTYDPATGTGEVSFTGTVHFTGHDGVLDLTIANPTIEIDGAEAALLLDTQSTDMEGEEAVNEEQQWVGEIVLDEAISAEEGSIELTELETTLTNEGASAFAGFYEAGEALDPITLSFEIPDCTIGESGDQAEPDDEQSGVAAAPEPVIIPSPSIPWMPITFGGLALLIIGFTIGFFVGGRKPKQSGQSRRTQHDETSEFDDLMGDNS